MIQTRPAPPSDDKRWRMVEGTMRRNGYNHSALIETLHTVQESFGFIDDTALSFVADSLGVPLSRAFGVATFYHFFTMKPPGEHTCVVCTGTACYIKGSDAILDAIEREFGIRPGETTEDGKISLLMARCLGSCGLAPVAVFDGNVVGDMDADKALDILRRLASGDKR
jgi:bidirectional [NiFe] hydrogenase diaphorase subunit